MNPLFLGIDGGGTKTHATILDASGTEVFRLEGPATLVDPARPDESIKEVVALARRAGDDSGRPMAGLWAGLAGAGSEPVRTEVEEALRSAGVAREVSVGTDAQAAFFDAFGDGPGILLVAGTGSVALGRGEKRQWTQVGGWGLLLGDEGSGYALAMSGLRGVVRAADGRGPTTVLTERLLGALGFGDPHELVGWVAAAAKRDVAALAPIICGAAADGDALAEALVESAIEDLVGHVLTAMRRLGPWNGRPQVALVGGLLSEDRPLRDRVRSALAGLSCTPVERVVDPARGAARMAMRLLGS